MSLSDTCMARFITGDSVRGRSLNLDYIGSLFPIAKYFASSKLFSLHDLIKIPSLGRLAIVFFIIILPNGTYFLSLPLC